MIKCIVTGKRVDHGGSCGIKIPENFKFLGHAKANQWAENAVKKAIRNTVQRVKHCKR